jgi:hypothetical protein
VADSEEANLVGEESPLTVVSTVKILRCPPITSCMRWKEWCSAELAGPLNEQECRRVWVLWW